MKKLFVAAIAGLPLFGCTEHVINKQAPAPAAPADPAETDPPADDSTDTTPTQTPDTPKPVGSQAIEDRCLDGQDMDAADVDVSKCPAIPSIPASVPYKKNDKFDLGAWEIGTTADGDTYEYGTLSSPSTTPRILTFDGGTVEVNAENLECWGKGYYRLRKMLQDPPAEYIALRDAGFQYRFFQFQTDLRNGPTGFREITSYQDHLVKWVTVIDAKGVCKQPTLSAFRDYAKSELTRRGLPLPGST